ncbi:hypothetical protein R3P38DRAFT_2847741 [Favolaschia claudopus]|uniref:F-box domain-containing protein n=1 Tax=Favolaschia claudopus TaxID=2862362 RepID=A0AAW0DVL2_9AGAR
MPSLPDLPTELLMEIVKQYPALYLEIDALICGMAAQQFTRNDIIRALSQTCRTLRNIFLPILWERVYAVFTERTRQRKTKKRSKMLERRMIGLRKTPYIIPHIRALSVTLEECDMDNWEPMAEFIRALNVLSSLEDLAILKVPSAMLGVFRKSMEGKEFPSVQRLAVRDMLAEIIPCFPNVHTFTFEGYNSSHVESSNASQCSKIVTVKNFVPSPIVLRLHVPNLKCLEFWRVPLNPSNLQPLEGMEALSEVRIRQYVGPSTSRSSLASTKSSSLQAFVVEARRVLQTSHAKDRKKICIEECEMGIIVKETLDIRTCC